MVPAGHEKNSPEPVTMQKFATYILSKWTKSFKYVALYEFTLDVAQLETAITFFLSYKEILRNTVFGRKYHVKIRKSEVQNGVCCRLYCEVKRKSVGIVLKYKSVFLLCGTQNSVFLAVK